MLKTLKLKLHPTPEQGVALLQTMERFNAACDWIAAHGVRGRAFNQFFFGGYLLHRFWPERSCRTKYARWESSKPPHSTHPL